MDKFQELNVELLKEAKFPTISGKEIVADLMAHQELWSAFTVQYKWRINAHMEPEHFWDLWGIILFTVPGREEQLKSLAKGWGPDVCVFNDEREYCSFIDLEEPFFSHDEEVWKKPKLYIEVWWEPVHLDMHPMFLSDLKFAKKRGVK